MSSIEELIEQHKKRLVYLSALLSSALALGDTAQVSDVQNQISDVQITLNKLQTLI